jgi:hypothetical protein
MVDPDFLIIERDSDKLDAFARGLLNRLRRPSRSYSFEMVKAATVWLVGAYVDARVPLAPEMSELIAGVVKWKREEASVTRLKTLGSQKLGCVSSLLQEQGGYPCLAGSESL